MTIECPYCHTKQDCPNGNNNKVEYHICTKCLKEQYAEGDK
jgi:hypothetical protein